MIVSVLGLAYFTHSLRLCKYSSSHSHDGGTNGISGTVLVLARHVASPGGVLPGHSEQLSKQHTGRWKKAQWHHLLTLLMLLFKVIIQKQKKVEWQGKLFIYTFKGKKEDCKLYV